MSEIRDFWDIPTIKRKLNQRLATYIDQDALSSTLSDYYTKLDVDGLLASMQAQVDGLLASMQAQVDGLLASMQAQVDTLQQALVDCGCFQVELYLEFDVDDNGTFVLGNWIYDHFINTDKIRLRRINGVTDLYSTAVVPINIQISTDSQLEISFRNEENINKVQVSIDWTHPDALPGGNIPVFVGEYSGSSTQHDILYELNTPLWKGRTITYVSFFVQAVDASDSFARWTCDYIYLLKQ